MWMSLCRNTSLLVPGSDLLHVQKSFCTDVIQYVAAARRGHCTLSITLSLLLSSDFFPALAEQPTPGDIYKKSLSFCFV